MFDPEDNKSCVSADCDWSNQILNGSAECETCGEYSYPAAGERNNLKCTSDLGTCSANQILGKSGRCEDCPAGELPEASGHACVEVEPPAEAVKECEENEIKTASGACKACEGTSQPNSSKTECLEAEAGGEEVEEEEEEEKDKEIKDPQGTEEEPA